MRRAFSKSTRDVDAILAKYDKKWDVDRIRNFSIIAHVDHGKSSLSDRLLEITGNVVLDAHGERQLLDDLKVERERGITVKARTASMVYDGCLINLVDTPGHVDFDFEVKQALRSCQGALLLVDSTQGIQAQTIANYRTATDAGLKIIPVLTKLDLPHSDPASSLDQIEKAFGFTEEDVIWTSAKSGEGCDEVLPAVIKRFPPPKLVPQKDSKFRALVVDSWYDRYKGTICLVYVDHGVLEVGDSFFTDSSVLAHKASGKGKAQPFTVGELGLLVPSPLPLKSLGSGQVGYMIGGIKDNTGVRVGDFLSCSAAALSATSETRKANAPQSRVFASVYPIDTGEFEELRKSLERLLLNDSSVAMQPENSAALGYGFRCGFLGKLHMEVFFQRLEDEFDTEIIATAPGVSIIAEMKNGETVVAETPAQLPEAMHVRRYLEPMSKVTVITPVEYMGEMVNLFKERRGRSIETTHLDEGKLILKYIMPWQEVIIDLQEVVKSTTSGFASVEYEEAPPEASDVSRVDLLLNGKVVDALSFISHKSAAERRGRQVALKLKKVIKRQQFEVIIQAAVGTRILAKERVPPVRKDVLTKAGKTVGGGDVTRKMKLLKKQKAGKKRLKTVGNVQLDQKAFLSVLER